ncbi:bifunctional 2',3'-cyclic-nucleotide 2'-phosphodiesterase/3'-nucleotidase [Tabrizicola sp. TH137]|uniref:5'-nucleotidase C-terminal domain-containing protein n=1 Tax=Tabrizicola sp. TH137 TaxID=2067452 RepID=UPI000C7B02DA|nr:5'-nucleotidase C-terminal domain-containing protein [Tabrizicola sp. TH137]PLL14302.1 bifunctional 2',3'-cyclic-nucleotide 2'-phosphodiesterase/3'-nucleotidase [Tabrizicola sp. TH137]
MSEAFATLRLLATTDLHAHAMGWDYRRDRPQTGIGLAALEEKIALARADCPNTLLLDNGDFLHGSALGDWAVGEGADQPHPMIAAMNALGYDAATLGNHEFSHGLDVLERALDEAEFPMVSANLHALDGRRFVRSGILIERQIRDDGGKTHRLRIGITGIAPPQTAIWESARIGGRIGVSDPVPAAIEAVTDLRRKGADVVVLLAHTGLGEETERPLMEHAAHPLARLSGADAIILGHEHAVFPQQSAPSRALLHGRPAVMPGFHGSHLGKIDLALASDGTGWRVRARDVAVFPTEGTAPQPRSAMPARVTAACGRAHRETRRWLGQSVGWTEHRLHSYFDLISPSLALRTVAAAQMDHVRRRLAGGALAGVPILSSTAPFRTGGRGGATEFTDIPAGPMSLRHLVDLCPHPDTVVALAITGAELAEWLERAVILFAEVRPGKADQRLLRGDVPGFDLTLIDGLSFTVDVTRPPRFLPGGDVAKGDSRRIGPLWHRGRRVVAEDKFIMVTNSFRAGGSGGFPACRPDRVLLDDGTETRTAVADYLSRGGTVAPRAAEQWRFLPVAGSSVVVETGAGAVGCLADIAHLSPEFLGPVQRGMARFRLRL